KNSYQAQKVIEEVVKEKPTARWLFLTLSTKNAIDGDHLEQSLKHMSKAFNKLKMYTKVKKNLVGFLRSTEVTVNKNDGSYNQHNYQAQKVIEEVVKEKPTARWLFLTLSTKNAIDGDHLEQSLKHMSKAFNKLKMYTKVKKNLVGFLRSTEVTVNKNDGSYNQH